MQCEHQIKSLTIFSLTEMETCTSGANKCQSGTAFQSQTLMNLCALVRTMPYVIWSHNPTIIFSTKLVRLLWILCCIRVTHISWSARFAKRNRIRYILFTSWHILFLWKTLLVYDTKIKSLPSATYWNGHSKGQTISCNLYSIFQWNLVNINSISIGRKNGKQNYLHWSSSKQFGEIRV